MIHEFQINTFPTDFNLEEIKKWLIEEDEKSNEGFYCNWIVIEKAFKNKRLVTLDFKESPIGFLVWSRGEICVSIDILEIKPKYRKKGIGKVFVELILEHFKQKGFMVTKLYCSPRKSERFWKKIGFTKFPNRGCSESDLTYFKPLIKIQTISKKEHTENVVELWDVEPSLKNDYLPKWTWNIEIKNDKLVLPIIQPCNYNWNLRWTKDGKIVIEDKVKYFGTMKFRVEYDPFLYIGKLIE